MKSIINSSRNWRDYQFISQWARLSIINYTFCFFVFLFFILISSVHAENIVVTTTQDVIANTSDDGFNPNYIISDAEILNPNTMSLTDIQNFLIAKNSFLANYKTLNADGEMRSAAEIIYDAAENNFDCWRVKGLSDNPTLAEKRQKCAPAKINPQFLLVLLQKEQSLIESQTPPTARQLDAATGYGCPDGGGCNPRWQGFGKQVNSAALQFYDYVVNPQYYTYKAGQLYTFTNQYAIDVNKKTTLVTIANNATAALYNYTPHVYNGNYNFYKIWQRYFTRNLLNGSLVQAEGEAGVWLIENGMRRPFLTADALKTRYDTKKILKITRSDLEKYPRGGAIRFAQYSIVRGPDGSIYLLVDDTKRKIINNEAFRSIGYNPEEIMNATNEELTSYQNGRVITASSTALTGELVQNNKTGGVYWMIDGEKAPILDAIFLKTKFKNKKIRKASPEELDKYTTVDPVKFTEGDLLKSSISSAVYVISENKKRPFSSGSAFEKLGYRWENVISVSPKILYLYENGESVN